MRKIPAPYTDPRSLFRHGGAARVGRPRLDFSVSVNPLGPPPSVLELLRRELPAIARYPDPESSELTERLAVLHGVERTQIVVGNGSNELIYAIARAFRPRRVAIAEPTYTEYLRASLLIGAKVNHWLAEGHDFDLQPFDLEGADLVWLCNANNPTGRLWPNQNLMSWIKEHPDSLFVVDEAFLPFRSDEPDHSLVREVSEVNNLIVLRSLTKIFALPGLRVGYAVANWELAGKLRDQLATWSVNQLAQIAGLAALTEDIFVKQTQSWFETERSYLIENLAAGLQCLSPVPTQANFILLRLANVASPWLVERFATVGILVRNASNFVGLDDRYVRVAVRTREENRILMNYLWEFLATPADTSKRRFEPEPCPARS